MKKKSLTIKDVAHRAGVSLATASRALSGRGYVSNEARILVSQAAKDLGYKPHAAARSLKLQRTNTIGLMIADIVNPFYSYLANGALTCAQQLGYHMILCATDEDPVQEQEYLELLMEERVDGIIAVPTGENLKLWQEALDLGVKLVLVDRELDGIEGADVVVVDNVAGAFAATSYLIELGHCRIGIINGPTTTTTGEGRLRGYYDALSRASIPIDKDLIHIGSFKRDSGFHATHRLLSLPNPPTAIFATNNVLGEAAMFAIRERNLSIPDNISLVIFDDVPWTGLTNPRITVVRQPTQTLGFVSVELLDTSLHRPEQAERNAKKVVLQPELTIRESCAFCPDCSHA